MQNVNTHKMPIHTQFTVVTAVSTRSYRIYLKFVGSECMLPLVSAMVLHVLYKHGYSLEVYISTQFLYFGISINTTGIQVVVTRSH